MTDPPDTQKVYAPIFDFGGMRFIFNWVNFYADTRQEAERLGQSMQFVQGVITQSTFTGGTLEMTILNQESHQYRTEMRVIPANLHGYPIMIIEQFYDHPTHPGVFN